MRRLLPIFFFLVLFSFFIALMPQISYAKIATVCKTTKVGSPQGTEPPQPAECQSANLVGTALQQAVIKLAKEHLNGTYVWATPDRNWASHNPNGNAPTTFDCSGFAGWVWYWASGGKVHMAGQTDGDWLSGGSKYIKFVTTDKSKLQPGDLVYFGSVSTTHHVGIYEGTGACGANDCFLEYYDTGLPGRENSLSKEPDYVGFLRPVVK
jgi:cell wall-associated NlpC family hydrolase